MYSPFLFVLVSNLRVIPPWNSMRTFASAMGWPWHVEDLAAGAARLGLGRGGEEAGAQEQAGDDECTLHDGSSLLVGLVSHAGPR